MKYHKDNVIYVDFTFKKRKIKTKPMLILYKLYSKFKRFLKYTLNIANRKKSTSYKNRETSNY